MVSAAPEPPAANLHPDRPSAPSDPGQDQRAASARPPALAGRLRRLKLGKVKLRRFGGLVASQLQQTLTSTRAVGGLIVAARKCGGGAQAAPARLTLVRGGQKRQSARAKLLLGAQLAGHRQRSGASAHLEAANWAARREAEPGAANDDDFGWGSDFDEQSLDSTGASSTVSGASSGRISQRSGQSCSQDSGHSTQLSGYSEGPRSAAAEPAGAPVASRGPLDEPTRSRLLEQQRQMSLKLKQKPRRKSLMRAPSHQQREPRGQTNSTGATGATNYSCSGNYYYKMVRFAPISPPASLGHDPAGLANQRAQSSASDSAASASGAASPTAAWRAPASASTSTTASRGLTHNKKPGSLSLSQLVREVIDDCESNAALAVHHPSGGRPLSPSDSLSSEGLATTNYQHHQCHQSAQDVSISTLASSIDGLELGEGWGRGDAASSLGSLNAPSSEPLEPSIGGLQYCKRRLDQYSLEAGLSGLASGRQQLLRASIGDSLNRCLQFFANKRKPGFILATANNIATATAATTTTSASWNLKQ